MPLDGEESRTVTVDEGVVDVVAEIKGALGIQPASSDVPPPSPSLPTVEESEDVAIEEIKLEDDTDMALLPAKEALVDEDAQKALAEAVEAVDAFTSMIVDKVDKALTPGTPAVVTPSTPALNITKTPVSGKKKMAEVMCTALSNGDAASKTKWKVARTFKVARPPIAARNQARVAQMKTRKNLLSTRVRGLLNQTQPRIDVTDVFAMKKVQFDFEGLIRNICGSLEVYVKAAPKKTVVPAIEGGLDLHSSAEDSVEPEVSLSLTVSESQDAEEEKWDWQPFLLDVLQLGGDNDVKWAWCVQEVVDSLEGEVKEVRQVRAVGLCDIEAIRISKKDPREFRLEVVDDSSPSDSEAPGADEAGYGVGGRTDYKRTDKGLSMIKLRTRDEKPCEPWVHAVSEVVTRLRFMQPREELSVERLDGLMS